ncbi:MAG: type III-A CRISPR-associated RAMP protein Csm5 [Acholeplasmataceae bacterium]
MSEKTKLKITTITPVAIGSGVELSPYSDYIIDYNKVCFIDKHKLQNLIVQNDKWLDGYVQGVATGMDNNRSSFDLKSFLLNNKIVKAIDEVIASRCDITISDNSKLPIKAMIKSPFQEPYFPGSSLKGALKTVLMYNWLKTNEKANQRIEEVIKGKYENGKYKEVNFNWLEKEFEYKEIDKENFIPQTIQQVTDSKTLPKNSNIVVDCDRKIPLRLECIIQNVSTEFELTLENYHWKDLANQANNYTFDCLNRELDLVEDDEKLLEYFNKSVDIQDLINNELGKDNSNVAYLRIGFGKGYYLNSLGLAIYDYIQDKDELYNKFESFLQKQFAKKGKFDDFSLEEFPRTRLMVKKTQEPLGWIKIEKI